MGADLVERGTFRLRLWQATLLALACLLAWGLVRAGASWGATAYDPAADPYSLQNVEAAAGVQDWWRAGYTGKGVDVAVIDTGVSPVAGLAAPGKVVYGPDLSSEAQDPSLRNLDGNGHGTFMAGLIAAAAGQPGGYRGVAPGARIVSVKVGAADGSVAVSQVVAAVDWVVQHRHDDGLDIRVLNLSYGSEPSQPYETDPLAQAVERAWQAGIVVVASAGNSGYQKGAWAQGLADPAYDPQIIAVGAADTMGTATPWDDEVAPFSATAASCSSACRAPDLVAPGTHLQGLLVPGSYVAENDPGSVLGTSYLRGSGTSEATAFVSGAVADLLQRYPALTPDQVKAMLDSSCDRLRSFDWKQQGCGELDLARLFAAPLPLPLGAAQAAGAGRPGGPWRWSAPAGDSASGSGRSGSPWSGSGWSGSSWSGSSWSGSSWSDADWLDAGWS